MKLWGRALLGLALLGNSCRHAPVPTTGGSSFAFIEPPAAPPPKSSASESKEPTNRGQYREAYLHEPITLPIYPMRALKAKAGRATVGVHIIVDVTGKISSIASSMFVFSTPGPFVDNFYDAVEVALRQWKFNPSRVEYVETIEESGFTYNRVKRSESVEAEFDIAFTFSADGRVEQSPTGK